MQTVYYVTRKARIMLPTLFSGMKSLSEKNTSGIVQTQGCVDGEWHKMLDLGS